MADPVWANVDEYLNEHLVGHDEVLEAAVRASAAAGLPKIQVSPTQGKFLHLVARALGARRVLEIGTLGGYSAIWLGRAIAPNGHLTTLEINPLHAQVARANIARAGLASTVEIIIGPALATLDSGELASRGPFDLVFIDADKPLIAEYVERAKRFARPGTVILVDNVVREGAVADPASTDPSVVGVRRFVSALARDPELSGTVLQTVGEKKHDGFAFVVVGRGGAGPS